MSIVGPIVVLAIVGGMLLSQSQSEAMLPDVEKQNQVTENQPPTQDKATATITITMTTAPNNNKTQSAMD